AVPLESKRYDGNFGSQRFWSDDALPSPSPSRRRLLLTVAVVAGVAVVALTSLLGPARTASVAQRGRDAVEPPAQRHEPSASIASTERTEQGAEQLSRAGPTASSEAAPPALPPREFKSAEPPRIAATQRQSSEMEQAKARLSNARRAAEQAGASYYAQR